MVTLIDKSFSQDFSGNSAAGNCRASTQASCNSTACVNNALGVFMKSRAVKDYPYPALVDAKKAAALLSPQPTEEECAKILELCRFSFMGTDGMRGKVFTEEVSGLSSLGLLTRKNILSCKIVALAVKAFVKLLEKNGIATPGDSFCTGNDGRDAATSWKLTSSMNNSFAECKMYVDDIGVTPTPYVPLYMLEKNLRGGAMLTASHNPSNQNGIKFFLDGKKLLNEGPLGAYALSAYMYEIAQAEDEQDKVSAQNVDTAASSTSAPHSEPSSIGSGSSFESRIRTVNYSERKKTFLKENLPSSFAAELRKTVLFIDAANGSWTDTVTSFLEENGVPFVLTSAPPTGANINAGCGVAEIEGHESYSSCDIPFAPEIVKAVYRKGSESQANTEESVFGIAVDGDGDRGFVLQYKKETDSVKVYDGDEEAFLIATMMMGNEKCEHGASSKLGDATFAHESALYGSEKRVVCTVESDVMAPVSMKETLDTECDTVDVGDKWICNYPSDKLLIGFESSGHVIIPCRVNTSSGEKTLLSGNGMLTAISTILSLIAGNKSFERGFSKTYYTYFVDKNLFYPDSPIWNKDVEIIESGFSTISKNAKNGEKLSIKRTAFKDPDVLAYSVYEDDMQTALLFSRNSGTEDKNAVYLKCRPALKDMLLPITDELCAHHRSTMRNEKALEAQLMKKAEKLFSEKGSIEEKDLTDDIQLAQSVLHALEREGKVIKENGRFKATEEF